MDYLKISQNFYQPIEIQPFSSSKLIIFNQELAQQLKLSLNEQDQFQMFSGLKPFLNFKPIALAYSGHQFGHFVPLLGDGRAALIGQLLSHNQVYDIQLKGSGPTPYSRRGDGFSALGPVLKEYLLSEAMNALKVPTTRALAAVATHKKVYRDQVLDGGIFTRLALGHIRVGSFEYALISSDKDFLRELANFTIERFYPHIKSHPSPYFSLFQEFSRKYLKLIAQWMSLGFIHGVMNTDNCSLSGETIDYGPAAFMDEYHPDQVFSFIDRQGRYRYAHQPHIGIWNLSIFARCLIPLINNDQKIAVGILEEEFKILPQVYKNYFLEMMAHKLGIMSPNQDDQILVDEWLNILSLNKSDFTNSFYQLTLDIENGESTQFSHFLKKLLERIKTQNLQETTTFMKQQNPVFIPRNHLIEKAITQAYKGDYSLFFELHEIWKNPFCYQKDKEHFRMLPTDQERIKNTFCGT